MGPRSWYSQRAVKTISRPIAIDLYAGAGGMSCGFEQAGFDIVLSVDNDAYHAATHDRNFPYGVSATASVADLTATDLRRMARLEPDVEVDLVFGGPPCQGFSHMGLRDVEDPRNSLVDHFVRIVSELRPRAFVMENVPGMNTGGTRAIFDHAVKGLEAAGYRLTMPVRVLNAAEFGVPQARKRLFVLGVRADCGEPAGYPAEIPVALRPTVAHAFEDLPDVDVDDLYYSTDLGNHAREPGKANWYARYARGMATDRADYSRVRKGPVGLTGCARVKHSASSASLYAATRPGTMVPGHKLPKLDPNGIAPTLRAGTNSERGSHTAPRPVHPARPRVITIREAARLHGYPDWFAFYPGKWHAYRQIGNSVCPPVARAVGLKMMEALGIDAASLPRPEVELGSVIQVAENRQKHHKRIQTGEEFPKVIDALWAKAMIAGTLLCPEVTVLDVEQAYEESGANLPRVRPARFVLELIRFRKAAEVLTVPQSSGYTLVHSAANGCVGRWVPLANASAAPERFPASVKSGDLNGAHPISLERWSPKAEDLVGLVEHDAVATMLGWKSLRCSRSMFGLLERPTVAEADGQRTFVMVLENGRLPALGRISKTALQSGCRDLVLMAAITDAHVLAARYRCLDGVAVETARGVFMVSVAARAGALGGSSASVT